MAAVEFDLSLFLESVGADKYTEDLLHHGVVTLGDLATLTQDKLKEWNINDELDLPRAIEKAERLIRSSDAVVQEELLVRDNFVAIYMYLRRKGKKP